MEGPKIQVSEVRVSVFNFMHGDNREEEGRGECDAQWNGSVTFKVCQSGGRSGNQFHQKTVEPWDPLPPVNFSFWWVYASFYYFFIHAEL